MLGAPAAKVSIVDQDRTTSAANSGVDIQSRPISNDENVPATVETLHDSDKASKEKCEYDLMGGYDISLLSEA